MMRQEILVNNNCKLYDKWREIAFTVSCSFTVCGSLTRVVSSVVLAKIIIHKRLFISRLFERQIIFNSQSEK